MILTAVTRFGNFFNSTVAQLLHELGWRPEMIGYGGIGSETEARIIGRALMSPTPFEERFEAWARNVGVPTVNEVAEMAATSKLPGTNLIADALGENYQTPEGDPTSSNSRGERGWRQFIDAQIPFQPVLVTLGKARKVLTADRGGYVDVVLKNHGLTPGWQVATIQALDASAVKRGEKRVRASKPMLVPVRIVSANESHGIVSDVDDTVMISWLPRPIVAAKNAFFTYVSDRQAVPGMSKFLQFLSHAHATKAAPAVTDAQKLLPPTIYLSTGAWNVAPSLRRFLARGIFPAGTPLMSDWGPSQTGWFRSGPEHKRKELRRLTQLAPHLKWFLVGDDGQHDPQIYAEFAAEYPDRVAGIMIRTLTPAELILSSGKASALGQLSHVFEGVPDSIPVYVGHDGFDLARQGRVNGLFK